MMRLFCFFSRDLCPPTVSMWVSQHAWEGGCWRGSPANSRRQGVRAGRVQARQHYTLRRGATQVGMLQRLAALRRPGCHLTTHAALAAARKRHFCCMRAGQQADEGCCFRGPFAACFEPEHNQVAAPGGLSMPRQQRCRDICVSPGLSIPAEGTDERGINCGLLPMPQGQPVADNLDAPGVLHGRIQVHISQAHIPGHTCARLAAYPGERSLKKNGARGKDAGGGARPSVITKHITRPAASAGPRCK